MSDLAINWRGL